MSNALSRIGRITVIDHFPCWYTELFSDSLSLFVRAGSRVRAFARPEDRLFSLIGLVGKDQARAGHPRKPGSPTPIVMVDKTEVCVFCARQQLVYMTKRT